MTGRIKQEKSFSELYSQYGIFVILVVEMIAGALLSSKFFTGSNLTSVIRQNVFIAILGFGSTFVMLVGCINIAYDTMLAFTGCIACMAYVATQNALIALLVGIGVGMLLGYAYGCCVTYLRLPPFIVGLGISSICEGAVLLVTNAIPISGITNTSFSWFGQGFIGPFSVPILIVLIMMMVTWFILKRTTFGRHAVAVGDNKNAAISSGIVADRVIRQVYILDGLCVGLAAVIFMSRLGSGQPSPGTGYGFDAITGTVVGGSSLTGGSGGAIGTFIGVLIVGVLNNIMNLLRVNSYWQAVAKGVMILIAVTIDNITKSSVAKSGARRLMKQRLKEENKKQ